MMPYAKNWFSKENENKFTLPVSDYQNNWEYYYIQYLLLFLALYSTE
jgi:hypothetical protein